MLTVRMCAKAAAGPRARNSNHPYMRPRHRVSPTRIVQRATSLKRRSDSNVEPRSRMDLSLVRNERKPEALVRSTRAMSASI
jgi:hypothetical protein